MNEYTASNEIQVRLDGHDLDFKRPDMADWMGLCGDDVVDAVREFFQAQADERLGIWRSQSDPSWTGIMDEAVDTEQTIVRFQNADHARSFCISRDGNDLRRWSSDLQAIAREWLNAHPEQKPWHDAKPGEVWLLTLQSRGADVAAVARDMGHVRFWEIADADGDPMTWGTRSADITDARRIFPEVAS